MQRTEQEGTEGLATHPSLCSTLWKTRHIPGEMRKGGGTVNHHWLSVSHTHTCTRAHTHTHTHTHKVSHSFRVSTLREQGEQAEFIGGKVKPHHLLSVSHTHTQARMHVHAHTCTHTPTHKVSILILSLCFRVSTLREQAEFIGGKVKFHSLCSR